MNSKLPKPEQTILNHTQSSPIQPDALDKALLDDAILPSSGFALSVMDSIVAETARTAAPAPIPFPWKLALPTLAAIVIALVAAIRLASRIHESIATHPDHAQINLSNLPGGSIVTQLLPALAAIIGTLLSLVLTRYLVAGRSSH